jgi:hypothetical protein
MICDIDFNIACPRRAATPLLFSQVHSDNDCHFGVTQSQMILGISHIKYEIPVLPHTK